MSIATEITRIKAAKTTINSKLKTMGLVAGSTVNLSECANVINSIAVHDFDSEDNVVVEDQGTASATYNLYAGYYPNALMLPHPDNGESGDTAELQATINSLNAEMKSIENQLKEL